jgi:cytochrome c556
MIRTIRTVLAMTVVVFGVGAVVAQTDPIAQRKDMMKQTAKASKSIADMIKGEAPFTSETVAAAYSTWDRTASEFGKLFPDNSKEGGNTRAKAAIWERRNDFDAKLSAFGKVVADAKTKGTSLEGAKAAMSAVSDSCNHCHDLYRAPAKK